MTLELKPGDVVQLGPNARNQMFAFCMLTVVEVKQWGVQGYVQSLGNNGEIGAQAYYRPLWEEMTFVGKALYTVGIQQE